MKIAVFYPHLDAVGGTPYETRSLVAALHRNGCQVLTIAKRADTRTTSEKYKGITVDLDRSTEAKETWEAFRYKKLLAELFAVRSALKRFDPDVCFIVGVRIPDSALFGRLLRYMGIRYILFPAGLFSKELLASSWGGGSKGLVRRIAERAYLRLVDVPLLRGSDQARAVSATEASRLKALGARRVFVVPEGVDRLWLADDILERVLHRPIRLLFVGRFEAHQKGLDLVLEALRSSPHCSDYDVVLAGPRHEEFQCSADRQFGGVLPSTIKIIGPVYGEEKLRLLRWADFFLHTSRYEALSKAPREALGAGLPLIASFESNFGDWVEQEAMGIATAASVASVSDTLLTISSLTSVVHKEMRLSARRFAESQSWDHVAKLIVSSVGGSKQ